MSLSMAVEVDRQHGEDDTAEQQPRRDTDVELDEVLPGLDGEHVPEGGRHRHHCAGFAEHHRVGRNYGAHMTTAQKVLVGYGVIVLVYGFVLGVPLSLARQKAPAAPRSLVTAHLSGLIQPSMMIAMAFALAASGFDNGWATAGAWLLVAGGAAEMAGGTTNWLQGTGDQFAENSLGLKINTLSAPLALSGSIILAIGVLANL